MRGVGLEKRIQASILSDKRKSELNRFTHREMKPLHSFLCYNFDTIFVTFCREASDLPMNLRIQSRDVTDLRSL